MKVSKDSLDFGYDEFHSSFSRVPIYSALSGSIGLALVPPSAFSAKSPLHLCLAALHGFVIYPSDERGIKDRVKKDGPYPKTLANRMQAAKQVVERYNDQLRRNRLTFTFPTIDLESGDPITNCDLEMCGLDGTDIAEAVLAYQEDKEFFSLGQSGRLNHYARHYGFPNLEALKVFIQRLDDEAVSMGFASYAALCAPSRYLESLNKEDPTSSALAELKEQWELLKQQTVFFSHCFVLCRTTDRCNFFVDGHQDGVHLKLSDGRSVQQGIFESQHLSDKRGDFQQFFNV